MNFHDMMRYTPVIESITRDINNFIDTESCVSNKGKISKSEISKVMKNASNIIKDILKDSIVEKRI